MKLRISAVALAVALLAGLAGPTAARGAAVVEWEDAGGDATGLPGMESSPRPSDPELDILRASFATQGPNLIASADVERMGVAVGSGATIFRFYFSFDKHLYYLEAIMGYSEYLDLFGGSPGFFREGGGDAPDEELGCFCRNSFDFQGHSVTFTVSRSEVARALDVAGPGQELTGLEVRSLRATYRKLQADVARPPQGATLRL